MTTPPVTVLREMRRTRRRRRLGELEWFEIAYRVYLTALFGGLAVMWLSDLVSDEPVSPAQLADVTDRGPAVIGLVAAAAVALGLRSGSDGGPISLEVGDARYLMTAPIPRREVLTRPVAQRTRAIAFYAAVAGAIAGQLAARRLPGSAPAWAASAAVSAALAGVAFVAVAVIAHALAVPRWAATLLAGAVIAAQSAAVAWGWPGPGDGLGSLAMWGMRTHPVDLVAAAAVLGLAVTALLLADRLRLEPLARRADLVSQLHFAVTIQDLRTVVLLRRQLRGERPRPVPWLALRRRPAPNPTAAVWQRDLRGLARYPLGRLGRMAALAALAGLAAVAVLRGTTPAMLAVGLALYLLGLDAVEPLSQEIDHPDVSDGVPRPRGWLLLRHFAAPAVVLVPFAAIGAAAVAVAEPAGATFAFALAVPLAWAGACGAIVSVVRDAPDPLQPAATTVPPEFAGFTSTMRVAVPIAISSLAAVAALVMRESPSAGNAVRVAVGCLLLVAAIGLWVRRRDDWRARINKMLEEGRTART